MVEKKEKEKKQSQLERHTKFNLISQFENVMRNNNESRREERKKERRGREDADGDDGGEN